MKKIRSLYFDYVEKNTSAAWEAFASACHRLNLDPETTAESFQWINFPLLFNTIKQSPVFSRFCLSFPHLAQFLSFKSYDLFRYRFTLRLGKPFPIWIYRFIRKAMDCFRSKNQIMHLWRFNMEWLSTLEKRMAWHWRFTQKISLILSTVRAMFYPLPALL